MLLVSSLKVLILRALACIYVVSGEGFLKATHLWSVDHDAAFQQAMASVMSCRTAGEDYSQHHVAQVERALSPMWHALPKNGQGRVEWKMLRYLAHRYFLQQSSLRIRGLEPVREVNDSQTGAAEILRKHGPSLVQSALESKRSSSGFSFEDAVALVGTVEQLVFESESTLLEKVFTIYGKPMRQMLTKQQLLHLLEGYILLWMVGGHMDDQEVVDLLIANRTELEIGIPHWSSISGMINGLITDMAYSRQQNPKVGYGQLVMSQAFSFEDAHQVVGALTTTFASFWESVCQEVKTSLEVMDYTNTGRVKLSDFYGANVDGVWHFGESEAYLREIGAMDESSAWNGKQVIISNYIQGASNCIVHSEHYFLCCLNECEGIMKEIERDMNGSPLASPEEIFDTLANITTLDDEPPKLTSMLRNQLEKIAEAHFGKVPLHGRLFAQWLHYVFPRECPFPHKTGSIKASATSAPKDYGDSFFATEEEVKIYASTRNTTILEVSALEDELMSQWSEEEELIADYSLHLRTPWQKNNIAWVGVFGSSLIALLLKVVSRGKPSSHVVGGYQYQPKVHFV